jgi:acyl carrier protein
MDNIEERVKNIIKEQLSYSDRIHGDISNGAHLTRDLGLDSLDLVEAVMALEDEFGIEVSDEDGERITTVQQAIDYVRANVKA